MLLVRTPLGYDYMQIGEQTIFQKKSTPQHRKIGSEDYLLLISPYVKFITHLSTKLE